ncbi:TetR/AcrR family transcriptional regulator [Mycolicibacterium mengxianglii]|uniref:TetR/AcrR family transcriptional regulator n=1 Tax=Mycolicibacterium mengxianglii TaxID=2736649 RepID=UPI0018D1B796|nr:TetR/AcrR family transcriptional regulator [Mycolicibacterium mengxianglii]
MPTTAGLGTPRRRRPKDRKEQIARVAAEAFSELGYHGVSMEDIAGRVGVTAASLYRHYAGKYDLFQAAVLGLGQQLVDCTAFVDGVAFADSEISGSPEQAWDQMVAAMVDVALANRVSGGLYRWEGRFLKPGDQLTLNAQIKLVNRRLQRPMAHLRPELDSRQLAILSAAVLSVLGSVTDHRTQLPREQIHATLARVAKTVRDTDVPAGTGAPGTVVARPAVGAAAGEYEQILHHAKVLFHERGYRDTAMEDIAAAVGVTTSSMYRFFVGKSAILTAMYLRAADRVSGDTAGIVSAADNPRDAVEALVQAYVRRSFDDPELSYVYYAERVNVPSQDLFAIANIQRATVEAWARQISATTPGLSSGEARFIVHAGFSLSADMVRLLAHRQTESAQTTVCGLVLRALLGPAAPAEHARDKAN